MEIDKRTHWWRPEDDEKATSGIPDCPRVLARGRQFCCRRLMPGDLASKAAARVTSFLASRLNKSRGLPGCAREKWTYCLDDLFLFID